MMYTGYVIAAGLSDEVPDVEVLRVMTQVRCLIAVIRGIESYLLGVCGILYPPSDSERTQSVRTCCLCSALWAITRSNTGGGLSLIKLFSCCCALMLSFVFQMSRESSKNRDSISIDSR